MRALLLDLDRTLIDIQSFTDYGAALEDVVQILGSWPDTDVPDTGWDTPTRACMAALVALSGDSRWATVSSTIERHELEALPHSAPMAGLSGFIETLPSTLPVAIVTLLGATATDDVLERHGVLIPVRVPRSPNLAPKPAPDQILEACRLLDVPPSDAVMVGDSTWDQRAAEAAGVSFIGVTNGNEPEFPPGTDLVVGLQALIDRLRD